MAGEAWHGKSRRGLASHGWARLVRAGGAMRGKVGRGRAGEAWQARRGGTWLGGARLGGARLGRQGMTRLGMAWLVRVRQAWKQTTDDPEICFGIMNKRPLTNTAHEATLQALFFFNTLDDSGGKNNG